MNILKIDLQAEDLISPLEVHEVDGVAHQEVVAEEVSKQTQVMQLERELTRKPPLVTTDTDNAILVRNHIILTILYILKECVIDKLPINFLYSRAKLMYTYFHII